jgi:lipopolysaccharide export system permease protein
MSQKDLEMMDVTVFLFEGLERFAGRIDAARARLENGYWHLQDVWISQRTRVPDRFPEYRLPTDLTTETIQDSFAAPETMSFWDLPAFIDVLERAGFSASRHRLHLHALLAGPFLLTAMVLIAATFSLRMVRRGGVMLLAGCGLLTGFVIYFFSDVVFALGVSARLPVELAAWAPTIVTGLLGLASLLHLEDG